ncbi:MAG: cysteine--tRNA ligase [Acidobacteriaceae bacterium]|nr:cysteine--tRNA ligase [Acidobacteriaceae bacterium]MBV9294151.1 cysteine--tRNA ligase [Acidobacteriaceae bacterium]MBV9765760.1 cysteine--tRNA ligase [Acidobacteriaceae bacterium]
MALRFYNTLTQELEGFYPLQNNTVRMYTCGPTVYNFVHIGNFRTFTFQDILRRWLRYRGYQLNHVMNVTDVDDKIIANAAKEHKSIGDYTAVFTKAFFEDAAALRLEQPEHVAPATKHIDVMANAIEQLAAKGCTYTSEGSTYFRISSFPEYGKLSHNDFSGIRSGARVDVDEYDKADARDFVLWKARKDSEPAWETPFGEGRPGWHIECSAMAMSYLGETLDIHAGGVDLIFPHHENEIAQSEAITGKPFARFWLHAEHLHIESQKMSKSLGNFYTLRDLLEMGYEPEAIRYLLASVPYRKKLNFTFESLKAVAKSIERLREFELRLASAKLPAGANEEISERSREAIRQFEEAMDDDLNTAEALAAIFEYVRAMNSGLDENRFQEENRWDAARVLEVFDCVFDVLKSSGSAEAEQAGSLSEAEIKAAIDERSQAKKARDFARADQIRGRLQEAGVLLEDTKDGVRWKRK